MNVLPPGVGDWYRTSGGGSASELFEVVAFDEADSTLEVQYFDGTIEELELSDWRSQCASGAIMAAEPPEDWSGAVDIEPEDGWLKRILSAKTASFGRIGSTGSIYSKCPRGVGRRASRDQHRPPVAHSRPRPGPRSSRATNPHTVRPRKTRWLSQKSHHAPCTKSCSRRKSEIDLAGDSTATLSARSDSRSREPRYRP